MTPTHTEKPLRRSEVGSFRSPIQAPIVNDDEEERRQRRRTAAATAPPEESLIEENETLKNYIKICNENKLSKENAWQVSVIDTLSKLLEKHHKVFSNFKVAGSSLEASGKIYGLRVDSIHTDVLRLSAGLNKKKFTEKNDDDTEQNNESQLEKNNENQEHDNLDKQTTTKRKKRTRKQVSTITKNKDTINSKLDTYPFTDPIFAKLNSTTGNINSSQRLLQNILPSINSEIMLRMDYQFWDKTPSDDIPTLSDDCDYKHEYEGLKTVNSDILDSLNLDTLNLRTIHTGYIICDKPAEQEYNDNDKEQEFLHFNDDQNIGTNESQLAMAFDINAEVEPIHSETPNFMDVDMGELDELTVEEQIAITHCRALRRKPIIIEDMRPLDSTSSNLEYSYRPIDKISQFWAGPSHWKFKRSTRNCSLSLQQYNNNNELNIQLQKNNNYNKILMKQEQKRIKRKSKRLLYDKQLDFGNIHNNLFVKIDGGVNRKLRKLNVHKKWDPKKLKLPTDLHIDSTIFDNFKYAPGLDYKKLLKKRNERFNDHDDDISHDLDIESGYNYNNPLDQDYCTNIRNNDDTTDIEKDLPENRIDGENIGGRNIGNNTILPSQTFVEIATDFRGAPDKVTRIIVPFAKRAKVIDMKQLKRCCLNIIKSQFALTKNNQDIENQKNDNEHNTLTKQYLNNEKYKNGVTKFTTIYNELPNILSSKMSESLSPSIAFYSILHLANENNLRLLPQDDLKDFQILQLDN